MTRQKAFRYKTHRIEEVAATTVENEMRTFRLFLRFCENYGCCPEGVASSVDVPTAPKSKRSRDVLLEAEQAEKILEYLETYEYCTFKHALFALMWHAGARIGGIRALDLDDFHPGHPDGPYLEFVHRPETETPLKNDWKSERKPAISDEVAEVLSDYIEGRRPDVTDKHGREPLLATKQGRPAKSTIQRNIYAITRPCVYTDECPHDREIDECEATGDYNTSMKCPSSRSPHALRRGRATTNANNGMPREMTCDRLDMSEETAEEHYLRQSEKDKRKLQREFLNQ
jgi:integrase